MIPDVSLMIMTLPGRERFAKRALDYYEAYAKDLRVRVMGNGKALGQLLPEYRSNQVDYVETGDCGLFDKIALALESAETPYVVLSADDDFVVVENLEPCVAFLRARPDYVMVKGHEISFNDDREPIMCKLIRNHSVEADDPLLRYFERAIFPSQILWGVMDLRLKEIFELAAKAETGCARTEQIIYHLIPLLGKVKIVDAPLSVRDWSLQSGGNTHDPALTYFGDDKNREDIESLWRAIRDGVARYTESDAAKLETVDALSREMFAKQYLVDHRSRLGTAARKLIAGAPGRKWLRKQRFYHDIRRRFQPLEGSPFTELSVFQYLASLRR